MGRSVPAHFPMDALGCQNSKFLQNPLLNAVLGGAHFGHAVVGGRFIAVQVVEAAG